MDFSHPIHAEIKEENTNASPQVTSTQNDEPTHHDGLLDQQFFRPHLILSLNNSQVCVLEPPSCLIKRVLAPDIVLTEKQQILKLSNNSSGTPESILSGITDISTSIKNDAYAINKDNNWKYRDEPMIKKDSIKVRYVYLGYSHQYFVTQENQVYAIGKEKYGLMSPTGGVGKGTMEDPMRLQGDFDKIKGNIVQLCGGFAHLIALTDLGEIVGAGYSFHGELGVGRCGDVPIPSFLPLGQGIGSYKIDMVASGTFHTLWKTVSNKVYVSGRAKGNPFGPSISSDGHLWSPVLLDLDNVLAVCSDCRNRVSWIFQRDRMVIWGEDCGILGKHGANPYERLVDYPCTVPENFVCQAAQTTGTHQVIVCFGPLQSNIKHFSLMSQLIQREKFVDLSYFFE